MLRCLLWSVLRRSTAGSLRAGCNGKVSRLELARSVMGALCGPPLGRRRHAPPVDLPASAYAVFRCGPPCPPDSSSTPWAPAITSSTTMRPRTRCTTATATAWPSYARSGSSRWACRACTLQDVVVASLLLSRQELSLQCGSITLRCSHHCNRRNHRDKDETRATTTTAATTTTTTTTTTAAADHHHHKGHRQLPQLQPLRQLLEMLLLLF
jgi:hypothetical protein